MIRAAISNAYYDARNAGETMETAADKAADSVRALIRAHLKEMSRNAMRYTKERAGFEDALRELESRIEPTQETVSGRILAHGPLQAEPTYAPLPDIPGEGPLCGCGNRGEHVPNVDCDATPATGRHPRPDQAAYDEGYEAGIRFAHESINAVARKRMTGMTTIADLAEAARTVTAEMATVNVSNPAMLRLFEASRSYDAASATDEGPDVWWCPGWQTLNATRYHGGDGPCTEGCGSTGYYRARPAVPDDTLRAALDAIEKAEREVIRLTGSGPGGRLDRHFRMSVPAEPDRDSDLVLMDALSKAHAALAASATDEGPTCANCLRRVAEVDAETGECRECFARPAAASTTDEGPDEIQARLIGTGFVVVKQDDWERLNQIAARPAVPEALDVVLADAEAAGVIGARAVRAALAASATEGWPCSEPGISRCTHLACRPS